MLTLKTAPASLADVMLQEVCDHLRQIAALDESPSIAPADLAHIEALTESAVAMLDGPQSKTRRALLSQTWTLCLDSFLTEIPLRLPPVQSIVSVKYRDTAGYLQTLGASKYKLSGARSWDPIVAPAYGETWPAIRGDKGSVIVEFIAGYGSGLGDVPPELRQAIRMLVAHWYAEREAVGFATPHALPLGVADLIQPFRVYR